VTFFIGENVQNKRREMIDKRLPMKTTLRLAALSALFITSLAQAAELIPIDVHRDANCGCCKKWIAHLEANGFKVNDHVEANMSEVKQRLGVPPRLASCHTGVINGKFVEGHVPAEQVLALSKRPWARQEWKWMA
jgi:hypothetical protein